MKLATTKILICTLFISVYVFSQRKVNETEIIGKWKLHLNKEIEEDKSDDDIVSKAITKVILTTVNELVKKVDIKATPKHLLIQDYCSFYSKQQKVMFFAESHLTQ